MNTVINLNISCITDSMRLFRYSFKLLIMSLVVGSAEASKPNIVVILADDLGWGDVSCYNSDSKIKTPNIDALAASGLRFTDGHSNSAVCTPTRYGVLTGRYAWRSRLKKGVLNGYSPALIEPERMTIASGLKSAGYKTACIGKWHLGMNIAKAGNKWDHTKPIEGGPTALGFDYFMGISASLDMPPYALIENDRFVQQPTETFKAVRGQLPYTRGGVIAPEFKHVDYLPLVGEQSVGFIQQSAQNENPFFLYLPLPSPHKPVLPDENFKGKSGIGDYGDYVMETDWVIGQVVEQLKKSGVYENTLIVVTSDNASFAIPETYKVVQTGHQPNAHFRGQKTDIYEGGHRVPFIVSWPAKVKASTVSNQVVCTTDIMPTALSLAGVTVPKNAAEDGYDLLPLLLNEKLDGALREATVHHSISGMFSLRKGKWKLVVGRGSGGRTKVPKSDPALQLYDMQQDPTESKNLYLEHPEIVKELQGILLRYKESGRSVRF